MNYYVMSAIMGLTSLIIPLLAILATYQFIMRKKDKKSNTVTTPLHMAGACIFCFALIPILSVTNIPDFTRFQWSADINLIPFLHVATDWLQYAMNVVLFIPFGFLLPMLWADFAKKRQTVVCGFLFSMAVEFVQLFTGRVTDINDLLMNTIGTILGFYLFALVKRIFPKVSAFTAGDHRKREPYACIAFAWFAVVFISHFTSPLLISLIGRQPVIR
jgi:glycopeptide antibiotics resistance protein